MKKRDLILTGILAAAVLAFAGCGEKEEGETKDKAAQVTVTPQEDTGENAKQEDGLVDMQQSTEEDIKNVMGQKTSTASKVVIVNGTGSDVAQIYIRPHAEDDEWGSELVQGMFTLKNGEKALYYLDKGAKDASGSTPVSYDIRIAYTDAYRSECFFRMIPLQNISRITLRMDGSGESSIPYATYLSGSSQQETSTLSEVKRRLGMTGDSQDDQDEEEEELSPTPVPVETAAPTPAPEPADDPNNTEPTDPASQTAEGFIGQPLGSLIAACGEPTGSDYENEPETGETGYHYYDTFTVSTTVDENGNEVVAGVW
ncbi:MAG: hypothetical protein Q4D55_05495 [Eubacteriales bacterium]|nr:hypothetical protein [Eubacteriales bacterium]